MVNVADVARVVEAATTLFKLIPGARDQIEPLLCGWCEKNDLDVHHVLRSVFGDTARTSFEKIDRAIDASLAELGLEHEKK